MAKVRVLTGAGLSRRREIKKECERCARSIQQHEEIGGTETCNKGMRGRAVIGREALSAVPRSVTRIVKTGQR